MFNPFITDTQTRKFPINCHALKSQAFLIDTLKFCFSLNWTQALYKIPSEKGKPVCTGQEAPINFALVNPRIVS